LQSLLIHPLVHGSDVPMHRQLYAALRSAILSSQVRPGTRVPATRELARELGVSRNTVLSAVDQLLAEGYLETRRGSGTYVPRELPDELLTIRSDPGQPTEVHTPAGPLSMRGELMAVAWQGESWRRTPARPFRVGIPAVDRFPHDTWARIAARLRRQPAPELLIYGEPAGYRPLREAIAERLRSTRAVRCSPDDVVITSGAQQGFLLAAQLLLNPGEWAWVEEPGYPGIHAALTASGVRTAPIPVDGEGLDVTAGRRLCSKARIACVTPSHQAALGVTMSLRRRLELLEWARHADAWVLEDDYNSEFRYTGHPLASLQGLDSDGRVIYVGTLSKVMFPALRLGYVVAPAGLADAFAKSKAVVDWHAPTQLQAEVAEFITQGHLERHIRRMRTLYQHRQEVLVSEANRALGELLRVQPSAAGLHVVGWLPSGADDRQVARTASRRGVSVTPLSAMHMGTGEHRPGLLLGYACYGDADIMQAVLRLKAAFVEGLGESRS